MRIRTRIWIEDDEGSVVYGIGRQRILRTIEKLGSIQAASRELGISYRGLWGRLRLSERRLGFALVDSTPGRGAAAGTKLTPRGRALIEGYDAAVEKIYEISDRAFDDHLRPRLTADDPD